MDVLFMTNKYREELCAYVKPYLDDEAFIWVRNLISDINKKIITADTDYVAAQAILMYRNAKKYFEEYCDDVTGSCILVTLYICGIELGVRKLGDSIESTEVFQHEVNMDDWKNVTKELIIDFDLCQSINLINKRFRDESKKLDDGERVWGGGLHTLQTIDFLTR